MRIVDAFIFFNELDLLEIRLNELAGVVDDFVLVESRQTFQGHPKRLTFEDNKERFARFPIHHVVIDEFPEGLDHWGREHYQRDAISWGWDALGVGPDDIVCVSDLDEIPSAAAVTEASGILLRYPVVCVLSVHHHVYFLNTYCGGTYPRVRLSRRAHVSRPQHTRDMYAAAALGIADGGWHWSYLGGVEAVRLKLASYSHPESNVHPFNDPDYIASCLADCTDLFGSGGKMVVTDFAAPPPGLCYPKHLTDCPGRYSHLMYPTSP